MAVFDVFNPPSEPDSDLDADLSLEHTFVIAGMVNRDIAPGDWVDVVPGYVAADSVWGLSFQVCNIYPEAGAVGILIWDSIQAGYFETQLDTSIVSNNYRRVNTPVEE